MKCCDFNAGMLSERVTFERRTRTATGDGGYSEAWTPLRATRAHLKASSGREVWAGDRVEARAMWKLTCRYFADLMESDRVIIRDKAYNIRHIDNVEMANRWYVLTVEKGAAS